MNIYRLSRVRLGTPLKSVNGFAFADTLTKTEARATQKAHPLTILTDATKSSGAEARALIDDAKQKSLVETHAMTYACMRL